MTLHDLFIFLVAGGLLIWLGISGLRINERIRASNERIMKTWAEAQEAGLLRLSPEVSAIINDQPRDWPWIGFLMLGGLTCIGALGWYLWLLLPQAPM